MTLIIEDGSIVSNAKSYITAQEYKDWADARFGSGRSTSPACDDDVEALIFRAMDYFEAQEFQGLKVSSTQSLQWPRYSVCIDSYTVSSASIPNEVKQSIYELAYAQELGSGELNQIDRKVKRSKVDVIEVEYADNASSTVINVSVPNAMKKLLAYGGGQNRVFRV